jgi:uncharacterized MnhB-related membrane protein
MPSRPRGDLLRVTTMGRQTKLKIDPATLRRLRLAFLLFTVFIGSIGTILVIIQDKPFDRAIWFGTIIALAPWVYYFLNRLFWRNEVYAMWLAVIHSPLYMTPTIFQNRLSQNSILAALLVMLCAVLFLCLCFPHVEIPGRKPRAHPLADPEIDAAKTALSES